MDPLTVLREYAVENKLDLVVQNGSRIDFGELYSFESNTPTRFHSRGGYYTLGAIFFFLKNKNVPFAQYFESANKNAFETVAMVDKKALLDFLEGRIESCLQLDSNAAFTSGSKRPSQSNEREKGMLREGSKIQKVEQGDIKSHKPPLNPENWTIDQIYKQEEEKFDAAESMQASEDFSFVVDFIKELIAESGPRERKQVDDVSKTPRTFLRPIILVPPGTTAKLSMYNVKEFLENGKYVFPQDVYKQSITNKEQKTLVARSFLRDKPVHYLISEKPPDKEDKETWKRVVAAVLLGKTWQFKNYPFPGCDKGNVHDMLHKHLKGFYVQYNDDDIRKTEVCNWNVHILTVHRYHRHGDNLLMQQFWREIDEFIIQKKLDRALKY